MKDSSKAPVGFRAATAVWARIGLFSFGGPAAQIALMHREIVDRHHWLSERQFLNALSFCMLLPGPEAMQLATYAGWRLHGVRGGLTAGLLFVIPGAIVIFALAALYLTLGDVPGVEAAFLGIKAAVVVIVTEALWKVARRALARPAHWAIAGLAFAGIFFLAVPFPVIVALAAAAGAVLSRRQPDPADAPAPASTPAPVPAPGSALAPAPTSPAGAAPPAPVSEGRRTLATVLLWLGIWWAPVLAVGLVVPGDFVTEIALFFSKLAIVTFGGAYAVLAYMAQDVVLLKGWLTAGQMMDGLGLAETTPGPLILVTQFVGFLAGFGQGGWGMAVLAALVTLWVTFAPCFLWIFAGAPYIDRLSGMPRLRGALSGITAAVVGVILNLSLWFALHVFFATVRRADAGWLVLWLPDPATLDPLVLGLAAVAGALLFWRRWPMPAVLALTAVAAVVARGALG